jgi:hypothetical protein
MTKAELIKALEPYADDDTVSHWNEYGAYRETLSHVQPYNDYADVIELQFDLIPWH